MGILNAFGLSTKKEVEEREERARLTGQSEGYSSGHAAGKESVIHEQQTNLSNLAKGSQIKFAVPYFDVFDPRFENLAVPVSVHGMLVYSIDDINHFNTVNKAQNYNDQVFEEKLKGVLIKHITSVVANAPADNNIPVLQMDRKILEIAELIQQRISAKIEQLFGINVRSLDITKIMINKTSRGYRELNAVTADLERDGVKRLHEMKFSGQEEIQRMQLENQREALRIQREEMQRASKLQTESNFLNAHQANLNASIGISTQQQMPQMGGMSQMMASTPMVQYMVGINGQPSGPYNWNQLTQLVQAGQLTPQSQVWTQGMVSWAMAGQIQELLPLFQGQAPTMSGMPQMPKI